MWRQKHKCLFALTTLALLLSLLGLVGCGPTVLFSDDFSQDTGIWDTFSDANGSTFYENGRLHVKDYTAYEGIMYGDAQCYFTDFILEVETWLVGGNDYNWHLVQCRCEDDYNYYNFGISADGYYMISKWVNNKRTGLIEPTMSSYINQGWDVMNLIHIECIGSSLSLSVNGHLLRTVTDTTFSGGYISLASNSLAGTFTEVAFDNIVVTEP